MNLVVIFGVTGAVIAAVLAGIGSARAMGMAGEAAAGVITEDPRKFGQTLVLQAIGSTNGIYGLLIGFLILTKTMALPPEMATTENGIVLLLSGIPVGVVGYLAAIIQGRVLVSGIILVGKRDGELAKPMIYAAMIETFAVFALLISFLIYNSI